MTKILYTFGTLRRFSSFLIALESSAKEKANVDKILLFNENDIDAKFYGENATIFSCPRGYGYWIWKSYFIKKLLEMAQEDDIFFYIDASNEIIKDLTPLYDLCRNDEKGIILFDNRDGESTGNPWKNNLWTKSDCFNLMGLKDPKFIFGNQINASYILYRKTKFSEEFFNIYANYCKNINIISDLPNITENFNTDFVDHRHDQSILSLLSIDREITIVRDPSQFGSDPYFSHNRGKYYIP